MQESGSTATLTAKVVGDQLQVGGQTIPGIRCQGVGPDYELTTPNGIAYTLPRAQLNTFVSFLGAWQQAAGGALPSFVHSDSAGQ